MARLFAFGQVRVYVFQGWTETHFPGGEVLYATHEAQEGQVELARELGYSSTEDMNRDHDVAHSALAHAAGLPFSPALFAAATGAPDELRHGLEEDAVKAFQKFALSYGRKLVT